MSVSFNINNTKELKNSNKEMYNIWYKFNIFSDVFNHWYYIFNFIYAYLIWHIIS